ncbi:glycosyltransferase family 4 protein [Chondrinema litorale]|uniref:glycosyltransferase family 4 protein n=1 Tax=Chondrinema litorale TaxID=2994555 RepID=UPI002542C25D|nr:glycosyltransferase family 1 protein [Chondrinema litorale]UZR98027.1 glycosyltransferase family 1 protein [Chondrinema litorale]
MKEANINMVSCQHFLSGIGQYGYHLSNHMMKEGKKVHLYKPSKKGYADNEIDKQKWVTPVKYRSLGNLHPYILPLFLSKHLAFKNSKDIYHAHWFLSGLAVSYVKKHFVVTMHDVSLLHVKEKNSHYTQYYSWAIERFKKLGVPIITVSESARLDAIEFGKIPENQVYAVYNGVDFNRFKFAPKIEKDTFTIVYAGGLGPRKNLKLLLQAFKILEAKYPHIKLKIAGAFPERTTYPAYSNSLGIKNVTFTGYLPDEDMGTFYQQGDLFIFPSEYEGFGFAPLEAMASGTPVLTTKGGSLEEVSGGGAYLFEYDIDDLVNKASELIEDNTKRKALIDKGLKWVQKYQWKNTAVETEAIYQLIA